MLKEEAMEAQKVTGGCLCGAVRYIAEAYLNLVYYCHCRSCQKSTGQPAEIGVLVKAGSLKFGADEPKYYNSSEFGQRGFCSNCGSRLVWRSRNPAEDWATNVAVCSLDHPEEARPSMHMFVDEKVPWYEIQDGLPRTKGEEADEIWDRFKDEIGGTGS
jgi:hypothetical protein